MLGLPRGGVGRGGAGRARAALPLDVLIVRKIGHPRQREFAVGALAENGVMVLDQGTRYGPVPRGQLEGGGPRGARPLGGLPGEVSSRGRRPLTTPAIPLVDDGLATGATTEAAVLSVRKQSARTVVVAAPVASTNAVERLARWPTRCACYGGPGVQAVGQYYNVFPNDG